MSGRKLSIEDVITPVEEGGDMADECAINIGVEGEAASVTLNLDVSDANDIRVRTLDPFMAGPEQTLPLLTDDEKRRAVCMARSLVDSIGSVESRYNSDDTDLSSVEIPPNSMESDEVRMEDDSWANSGEVVNNETEDSSDEQYDPFAQGGG